MSSSGHSRPRQSLLARDALPGGRRYRLDANAHAGRRLGLAFAPRAMRHLPPHEYPVDRTHLVLEEKQVIIACCIALVLCMCSSDGWEITDRSHIAESARPHVPVDHPGRGRSEFCLQRALIRELRPFGRETLAVLMRTPLVMSCGRRHDNFFTAATAFVSTFAGFGARVRDLPAHIQDGLRRASFSRLRRGIFARSGSAAGAFEDEPDRILHWVWSGSSAHMAGHMLAATQSSSASGGARPKPCKRTATFAIQSGSKNFERLRGKINEFMRNEVLGIAKDTVCRDIYAFLNFSLIREDLLDSFIVADKVCGKPFSQVNEYFFRRNDATQVLECFLLYLPPCTDWSEKPWCVVKCVGGRMLCAAVWVTVRLIAKVKISPDDARDYINGFDLVTVEVPFRSMSRHAVLTHRMLCPSIL